MPLTYPPEIASADFPSPPPLNIVNSCPVGHHQCSLVSLELTGHPAPAHSFTAVHADLPPAAPGRYRFAPGVETLTVRWGFSGEAYIVSAQFELYRWKDAQPVWTKTLRWDGARAAQGTTPFDGSLGAGVHATASNTNNVQITYLAHGTGFFPGDVLTAEHAPYRLKMSIIEVEPQTKVVVDTCWIYLDVVVLMNLFLGPQNWLPPAATAGYEDTRLRAHRDDTWTWLNADLNGVGGCLSGPTALPAAKVMLRHNVFAKSSKDFYDNSVFCGSRKLWHGDPVVPVKAELRIEKSDGQPAQLAAGAPALGGLHVLWDWFAPDPAPHTNATARSFIEQARSYKLNDWPHAGVNCHYEHGGKRGAANPDPYFEAAAPLPNPANALVVANSRPWSTFTLPVTDSNDASAGIAGVLFMPSRIAGDTYRLRALLAYPNPATVDVAPNSALRAVAPGTAIAESPTVLTVWRRFYIARHFRKHNTVSTGTFAWAGVAAYYAPLCVDVVPPPHGTEDLTQHDYAQAFGRARATISLAMDEALDTDANQHNGGYALNPVPWNTFINGVTQALGARKLTLVGNGPYATDALLVAQQRQLYAGNGPWYTEDLFIPTNAILAKPTNASVTAAVLADNQFTDADVYKTKVNSWSYDIISRLCGELTGQVAPNEQGIYFFHFDFDNPWHHYAAVGYAHTTKPSVANCPSCGNALPVRMTRRRWTAQALWRNRICACSFRVDDHAVVTMHAPLRYMDGQIDPWGEQNLSYVEQAKIRGGRFFKTTPDIAVTHEIGHTLGMPHAGPAAIPVFVPTGGIYNGFHDSDDNACIMSYNFRKSPELHFCGICSLRIAGWSAGPSDANHQPAENMQDRHTIQLLNVAADNRTQLPHAGAAWIPDATVNACHTCGTAFTPTNRRHHCRACGNIFCSTHCWRTARIRRPLTPSAPQGMRVCDNCQLSGWTTPPARAFWHADDFASACTICFTEFSDTVKRYHCPLCGYLFCDACSSQTVQVNNPLTNAGPQSVLVCETCYPGYS